MERLLEPEVMDTPEEAADYDAMDHGTVNVRFCDDLLQNAPIGTNLLDVGTGTAQIPIELCRRAAEARVVAIDLAEHMLALGRKNVTRAGLSDRITLAAVDAKKMPYADGAFDGVISNSIIHHIPEPLSALVEMHRVVASGGLVFVRDLFRPPSDAEVDRLVVLYGGEPPADVAKRSSFEHQRDLFRASLKAALTVEEVVQLAREAGIEEAKVQATSDRHWTLIARKR